MFVRDIESVRSILSEITSSLNDGLCDINDALSNIIIIRIEGLSLLQSIPPTTANKQMHVHDVISISN